MRNHLSLGLAFLLVLSWAALAAAQTGIVLGTVTDPSGAVVPNAEVTLQNKGTGDVRTTRSATDPITR